MPAGAVLLCLVLGAADGAALRVRCEGNERIVRLAGIDAPDPRQSDGPSSRRALRRLCEEADASVVIRSHDHEGRIVADVSCRGVDAAASQVALGWARVHTAPAPADLPLIPLQARAQAEKRGLWARPASAPGVGA